MDSNKLDLAIIDDSNELPLELTYSIVFLISVLLGFYLLRYNAYIRNSNAKSGSNNMPSSSQSVLKIKLIFQKYNPKMLGLLNQMLIDYKGSEEDLLKEVTLEYEFEEEEEDNALQNCNQSYISNSTTKRGSNNLLTSSSQPVNSKPGIISRRNSKVVDAILEVRQLIQARNERRFGKKGISFIL
jgi:hypothetical protein